VSSEAQSRPAEPRHDAPLSPGVVLGGRYEIIEARDEVTFGTLYLARARADGAPVTVEILDGRLFGDARVRGAVRAELAALQGVSHKNLAMPLDFGEELLKGGAVAYVVYEQLDGQSLAEMQAKKRQAGKPFSLKGAYNVVAHLANGLGALHARSPHGALSTRSVHVSSQGRVKVLEIGIARALLASGARGVLAPVLPVVAPEAQAGPDKITARTDVFGTGAILYELLTGRPPDVPPERASQYAPGLAAAMDTLLDQCLRARPEERFADMSRLKESLQAAVGPEIAPQGGTSPAIHSTPEAPAQVPVLSSAPAPAPTPAAPRPAAPTAKPPTPPPVSRSAPTVPAAARPAPPAPAPAPAPRPNGPVLPAAVPKSFSVDSALSSADESTERWLIQKDKLDFGPFNLRDVRAQIEAGKIQGEHTITDTETGERRRVKDHPQLRELVVQAEASLAENERMRHEQQERSKHRGRVVTLLGVIMLVVLAGGGGLFWYVQHMKAKVVVVKEQAEPELKFEISMKVDPPEKRPGKKRVPGKGGKNVFDDSQTLGDASEGGGDETLDGATVQRVMSQNFKVLVGCVREERSRNPSLHTVDMDFIIKGSGSVSGVKVNGQTSGPFAACMYGKMQSVTFPKFNGSKTHASFSLNLK
jgi:eukaryotic-like serine/threonine-protein kinase